MTIHSVWALLFIVITVFWENFAICFPRFNVTKNKRKKQSDQTIHVMKLIRWLRFIVDSRYRFLLNRNTKIHMVMPVDDWRGYRIRFEFVEIEMFKCFFFHKVDVNDLYSNDFLKIKRYEILWRIFSRKFKWFYLYNLQSTLKLAVLWIEKKTVGKEPEMIQRRNYN